MDWIYWCVSLTLTYSTNKAGVMPGVTKGLQELVSGLDGELTSMASSSKQTVEVFSATRKKIYMKSTDHRITVIMEKPTQTWVLYTEIIKVYSLHYTQTFHHVILLMKTTSKQFVRFDFDRSQSKIAVKFSIHQANRRGQCGQSVYSSKSSSLTLFTVWYSILQMEDVVSDGLLAASTLKAVHMPRLFEGIYHLLGANANNEVSWRH